MIRRLSLQARLLVLLAILLALLCAGLELAARRAAQGQADRELLEELRVATDLLAAVSGPAELTPSTRRTLLQAVYERQRAPFGAPAYELIEREGPSLRSDPFPRFSSPPPPGIATVRADTDVWRVLTVVDLTRGTTRRAALSESARQDRVRTLRDDLSGPWTIVLPLFAIAVLGSVWFGLRPLRRIEQRISTISPYDPEPLGLDPERMPREVGTLARAFDGLATRLSRVMSDQRIFASAASHELRTPLAGALSQFEVLRRAPKRTEALERLGQALSHMERLVAQLLFLARSDTVAASDRSEAVDLVRLAREAGEELDLEARLEIDGKGTVTGYPDLLRSLIRNLIRNADQASGGGPITVKIDESGKGVRVAVLDRGPGIPEADREALLEPFERGKARAGTGAGLGLTVAQRIAELHGGRITIAERPGGGASVSAILVRPA